MASLNLARMGTLYGFTMARPPKLTDKQWAEIEKRVPPLGAESIRSVAKEFKVSEGTIRKRVNTHTKPVNRLANQIAKVEQEFEALPISTQVKVRTLADRLKGISEHLAGAAELGAMTAHRLSAIANTEIQKVDETKPLESLEQLKGVAALTDMANKASQIGVNLLAANKDRMGGLDEPPDAGGPLSDQEKKLIAGRLDSEV